ncbi:MAG: methyltransferase domain-containing protein [Planctomycetota bacterium]
MFPLRCSVRGCTALLSQDGNSLRCPVGHTFNRSREGYWSLIQPQDRKSIAAGDPDEAVLARRRWIESGVMAGLVSELRSLIDASGKHARVVDLGCGEGTFSRELFAHANVDFCGIDLAKRALRLAARSWKQATWVLANADRPLPLPNASADCVLSFFGRRPTDEMQRIMAPEGRVVIAVPGADDLSQLREQVQSGRVRRSRWEGVAAEMEVVGLPLLQRTQWREEHTLSGPQIADALLMTYRGRRRSQQPAIDRLSELTVTLSADLLVCGSRKVSAAV